MKNYYGTLNSLEVSDVSFKTDGATLSPTTPESIKRNLKLEELNEKLFPLLVTGVSTWPFLSLTFDCESDKKKKSVTTIARKLKDKAKIGPIGPGSLGTVGYYRSMSRKIEEAALNGDNKCKGLYKFLKQKRFKGTLEFFITNEPKWKEQFKKANGKQATAFIRAYNDYRGSNEFRRELKEDEKSEVRVPGVVTQLLKKPPACYDILLWRAAFSYAFVRCLFGVDYDREDGTRVPSYYSTLWKQRILETIEKYPQHLPKTILLPQYIKLLKSIKNEAEPPLAKEAKKAKKENKRILSGLRLGVFYNLYYKPTRDRLKQNLNK